MKNKLSYHSLWKNEKLRKYFKTYRLVFLGSKFFDNRRRFSQKKTIYWPVFKKINKFIFEYHTYHSLQLQIKWIKNSYKNALFVKNVKQLKFDLFNLLPFFDNFDVLRKKKLNDFILVYRLFFFNYLIDLINFLFMKKKLIKKFFFYMYWNFKSNQRLYINLQNHNKRNFLFLSNGLFLKYFEKRKSIKKNKSIKMLLARYIRKLYLLVKFKYTIFFIKNIPTYLSELMNVLNTPIIHKFANPFLDKIIEEVPLKKNIFNINYFIFIKNIDFSTNKTRKRGRVKRKITRKLVLENSITD